VELLRGSLGKPGHTGFQLHISSGLKGLQPVKDRAVFAPGRAGPPRNWLDLGNGLTLHFQIDFRVAVRGRRAGLPQQMADRR
jgi:hypothetical protein